MSTHRRPSLNVFGLAFLDIICCGFGAALLLFILVNQRAVEQLGTALSDLSATDTQLEQTRLAAQSAESIAMIATRLARSESQNTLPEPAFSEIRTAIILLDVSGSMSNYVPDTPEYAHVSERFRKSGLKWSDTIDTLTEVLLALPQLEFFAVRALTDNLDRRQPGALLWPPSRDRAMARSDPTEIQSMLQKLRATRPQGGSNHFDSLSRIYQEHATGQSTVDAIIIFMDGLPNHGPLEPEFAANAQSTPDTMADPDRGLISLASRESRASRVVDLVRDKSAEIRASGNKPPVIHCVLVPWPDDPGIVRFALSLAGPTGGRVVSLTSRPFQLVDDPR